MAETYQAAEYHARIRDLPASDRPRERLRDAGPGALSNPELLALVLRTGAARESAWAIALRRARRSAGRAGRAAAGLARPCARHGV